MVRTPRHITIQQFNEAAAVAALWLDSQKSAPYRSGMPIYGIPRGGITAAYAVANAIPGAFRLVDNPKLAHAFVDDIIGTGATRDRFTTKYGVPFVALFKQTDEWLVFPYERPLDGGDESATDIVTRLLTFIGEDPTREGLKETPARVLKAWQEWGAGYKQDPASVLKTFKDGADGVDEMVIVHNIPVVSHCEHHLAPMHGMAHVGYIPNGKIVGLSKIPRLVKIFAQRLQVQERLTNQIADAMLEHLKPIGVGVTMRLEHGCMSSRGVHIHGSTTTTTALRGAMFDHPTTRAEFLQACRASEGK